MRFFAVIRSKWEGNTLVVDTTNLDGRAYFEWRNTFAL